MRRKIWLTPRAYANRQMTSKKMEKSDLALSCKAGQAVICGVIALLLVTAVNRPVRAEGLVEYRTEGTRPFFLATSGTTWFTGLDSGRSVVGEVDPSSNTIRRFYLVDDTELTELVLGPEFLSFGSSSSSFVWFLQQKTGRIARLNPATGETSEWQIPTPNSKPTDIIIYRYGNGVFNNTVFFTEHDSNRIGALAYASGQWVFKEFTIPTPNSKPVSIAVDDSGLIWFTESEANKIGRLDPSKGEFAEYLLAQGSRPWGITIDNNNLVWVVATDTHKIIQLDPQTGWLDVHDIPTGYSRPRYVEADMRGNIWFTEFDSNKIGRYVLNNTAFVEYSLPEMGAGPNHISITRPNGDVWFTEIRANRIARLLPDTRATVSATRATASTASKTLAIETASTTSLAVGVSSTTITGVTTTPSTLTTTTTTMLTTTTMTATVSLTMTTTLSSATTTTTTQSASTTTVTATPSPRCVIASAAYGSDLAPQVQLLRDFRDSVVISTFSGSHFMYIFNRWYYSFSPVVAELIQRNSAAGTIARGILYPLIEILGLASRVYSALTFSPELAVVLAGLTACSLVGIIYLLLSFVIAKKGISQLRRLAVGYRAGKCTS
ncbi:MAG: CFI-box-CTERM domain-containing protein [archaeon]